MFQINIHLKLPEGEEKMCGFFLTPEEEKCLYLAKRAGDADFYNKTVRMLYDASHHEEEQSEQTQSSNNLGLTN